MKSIELFAGAGGLGMGVSLAGFGHLAVIERNRWACDTIRENQHRGYPLVSKWNVKEDDVRKIVFSDLPTDLDLIAAGPPCQPFSMGGKHKAYDDSRDMFPVTIEAIRKLEPRSFIIENVKGLTRPSFANYFQYILLQLEFPSVAKRSNEDWKEHYRRLQAEKTSGRLHSSGYLGYNVVPTLVNASDYGIPQKRERIFIVGFRDDLNIRWNFPRETHSYESLLHEQWVSGDYWDKHRIPKNKRPSLPSLVSRRLERLKVDGVKQDSRPWRTVRDALQGLPDPEKMSDTSYPNHKLQIGAKQYPGHTGSPLDLPAKTLKAGDHGVPGGENMMIKDNGEVRYFTVRESARLQTFPDGYIFHGTWSETMRQLGNAVPVGLAYVVASSVAERLVDSASKSIYKKTKETAFGRKTALQSVR